MDTSIEKRPIEPGCRARVIAGDVADEYVGVEVTVIGPTPDEKGVKVTDTGFVIWRDPWNALIDNFEYPEDFPPDHGHLFEYSVLERI